MLGEDGPQGLDAVQAVRAVTGLSAWRSKELLGSAPTTILEVTWFERAAAAARRLNAVGVRAELSCDWCKRVMSPEACPVDPGPCSSPYWPRRSCQASQPRP
ncbi:hypothetical protein [Streptacidiphilus anmyonensis]|uniref:hypothetical protein n=1 Tax=Streptacidiphilus anmyonensis TaxID=405782 RepID=UPI0009FD3DBB|nr:hypothetical protein [Streptacidiphilus anmyonensis]